MAKVKIVYGTTGGNTELVCEKVAMELEKKKHRVALEKVELCDVTKITACDFLILASPTYGHGQLEDNFHRMWPKFQKVKLNKLPCAVIALGDPKYEMDYLLESANILTEFIKEHGGVIVLDPLKLAKNPLPYFPKAVLLWTEKLHGILSK